MIRMKSPRISCKAFKPISVPLFVAVLFGAMLAIDLSILLSGCRDPNTQDGAKAAFSAELAACVDYSNTQAEADACFGEVSKRWGFCKNDAGTLEKCK